jgi:hypothetical protein
VHDDVSFGPMDREQERVLGLNIQTLWRCGV